MHEAVDGFLYRRRVADVHGEGGRCRPHVGIPVGREEGSDVRTNIRDIARSEGVHHGKAVLAHKTRVQRVFCALPLHEVL